MNSGFESFCNDVIEALEKKGYEVLKQRVSKNNTMLTGITLGASQQKDGSRVAPMVYLEDAYHAFFDGEFNSIAAVADSIEQVHKRNQLNFDIEILENWDTVKDRIYYELVGLQNNGNYLAGTCVREVIPGVLGMVFNIHVNGNMEGNIEGYSGSILVKTIYLDKWGISEAALYEAAVKNTPQLYPAMMKDMLGLISEKEAQTGIIILSEKEKEIYRSSMIPPMIIISNTETYRGAAVIMYPGLLDKLSEQLDRDLFVIPSSIHECIIIPDVGDERKEELEMMVREVNSACVAPQEKLTDTLLYYSRKEGLRAA